VSPAIKGFVVALGFLIVMAVIAFAYRRRGVAYRATMAKLDNSDYATLEAQPYQLEHIRRVLENFGWKQDPTTSQDSGMVLATYRKLSSASAAYSKMFEALVASDTPQKSSDHIIKVKAVGLSSETNAKTH
jgi:hypothetical protein